MKIRIFTTFIIFCNIDIQASSLEKNLQKCTYPDLLRMQKLHGSNYFDIRNAATYELARRKREGLHDPELRDNLQLQSLSQRTLSSDSSTSRASTVSDWDGKLYQSIE